MRMPRLITRPDLGHIQQGFSTIRQPDYHIAGSLEMQHTANLSQERLRKAPQSPGISFDRCRAWGDTERCIIKK